MEILTWILPILALIIGVAVGYAIYNNISKKKSNSIINEANKS